MSKIKSLDKWFNNLSVRGRVIVTIIFFAFLIPISTVLTNNFTHYFGGKNNQAPAIAIPIEQKELLGIFNASYREYAEKKGNDALESMVKEKQAQKLCDFFGKNNSFTGWVGRVSEINSSVGESFSLRVKMDFDNEKFNTLYFDHDNIKKGSQLYESLINLAPKDLVIFSGEVNVKPTELNAAFERLSDAYRALEKLPSIPKCRTYREGSLSGSLERPMIEFIFSNIKVLERPKNSQLTITMAAVYSSLN